MNNAPIISTPKGVIYKTKTGRIKLDFYADFQPKWQGRYNAAQRFVDSEILRLSEPYTPLLTGTLIKSGILGTDIGSAIVSWITPYAAAQYYRPKPAGSQTGMLRGPFWFERMKTAHGQNITKGAGRFMRK